MTMCQSKLHFNTEEREAWIHVKSVLRPRGFILYGFQSHFKHKATSNYYIYFKCKAFEKNMKEQIKILRWYKVTMHCFCDFQKEKAKTQ